MADEDKKSDDAKEPAPPASEGPSSPAGSPPKATPPPDAQPAEEDLRLLSEEISSQYPPPRLGTELVLLEVDPHRAHAYWNVDLQDYEEAKALAGEAALPLVLRVYDITGIAFNGSNAHEQFDVEVQGLQSHWYLDLWQTGRTYVADLGFRKGDGTLVSITRSNTVETPRAAQSADYNTVAVHTGIENEHGPLVTDLLAHHDHDEEADAGESPTPGGETAPAAPAPRPALESDLPPMSAWNPMKDLLEEFPLVEQPIPESSPVTDPEPVVEAPEPPPPVRVDDAQPIPLMGPAQFKDDAPRENWPKAEEAARAAADVKETVAGFYREYTDQDSAITAAHAASASEARLHEPPPPTGMTPSFPPQAPSASAPAFVPQEGSPAVPASPADVSQTPAPVAPTSASTAAPPKALPLESYVNLSSFEHAKPEVQLEINTEIHIFGRAKPGSELTLYGQKVALRPDGTFSIRKPLPQGAIVLPLLFHANGNKPHGEGG